jgi:hypothetical protein
VRDKERLIDFVSDSDLKEKFRSLPLTQFWSSLTEEYPTVAKCAVPSDRSFCYNLFEIGFSRHTATKINTEMDLMLWLT